jgi:hypothetical protein
MSADSIFRIEESTGMDERLSGAEREDRKRARAKQL